MFLSWETGLQGSELALIPRNPKYHHSVFPSTPLTLLLQCIQKPHIMIISPISKCIIRMNMFSSFGRKAMLLKLHPHLCQDRNKKYCILGKMAEMSSTLKDKGCRGVISITVTFSFSCLTCAKTRWPIVNNNEILQT